MTPVRNHSRLRPTSHLMWSAGLSVYRKLWGNTIKKVNYLFCTLSMSSAMHWASQGFLTMFCSWVYWKKTTGKGRRATKTILSSQAHSRPFFFFFFLIISFLPKLTVLTRTPLLAQVLMQMQLHKKKPILFGNVRKNSCVSQLQTFAKADGRQFKHMFAKTKGRAKAQFPSVSKLTFLLTCNMYKV